MNKFHSIKASCDKYIYAEGRINMKIGIDIDGVLNDEAAFLIDYGTKYSYECALDYLIDTSKNGTHNIYDWPPVINDQFWEKHYLTYLSSDKYIRQFSCEVISKLQKNHEIHIITARDTHNTGTSQKDVEILTKQWLAKHQIQYDAISFLKNKYDYIKQNGIDIMIEDNPDTIMELCNYMPIICYHTAYNNHVRGKNIFCVNSWYEVLKFFETDKSFIKEKNGQTV